MDTLALSEDLLQLLARRQLALPLVYISEGANRAWEASDAAGNPAGRVTVADLNLPLESSPVERVQFGLDGEANLLWAVERTLESREVESRVTAAPAPRFNPGKPPARRLHLDVLEEANQE